MEAMGQVPDVQVADVLVAYDHPISQRTYILRFNQVLVFDELSCHLLTPNQMRLNDVVVDECPRVFCETRHQDTHSIRVPDEDLVIPLFLDGVNSVFKTRRPTDVDLAESKEVVMTYDTPAYDPHDSKLAEQEAALIGVEFPGVNQDMFSRNVSATTSELSKVSAWHSPADALEELLSGQGYAMTDVMRLASSVTTRKRRGAVTAEQLARRWRIGLETARKTIKATTQKAVRYFDGDRPTRRMGSRAEALRFRSLRTFMSTDTKQGPCVSRRGNKYLQVYTTDENWSTVYPIKTRKDAPETLELLFRDAGVPSIFSPDCAPELTGGEFRKKARAAGSMIHPIEPRTPNHQRCETTNNVLSQMYVRAMRRSNAPTVFWDDCYELQARILALTAHDRVKLRGEVPETILLGDTADISAVSEFEWYEPVWFWNPGGEERYFMGRWLGPSRHIGQAMTSKILMKNGQVVNRSSVFPWSDDDRRNEQYKLDLQEFDNTIREKYGPGYNNDTQIVEDPNFPEFEPANFEPYDEDVEVKLEAQPDADDIDFDTYNKFISAEVLLPDGIGTSLGKVTRRKHNADGVPIGQGNANPFLDTSVYEVELADGRIKDYSANVLAEHIYSQVDDAGRRHLVLKELVDHKKDATAVTQEDKYVTGTDGVPLPGNQHLRKTTKGWWLLASWKDGTESWERLADLKESHPLETAEYAIANQISKEPAFEWWVNGFIKDRERLIKKVKARIVKKTHKFGIEVPTSVAHAVRLDEQNGNRHWQDAISLEMRNVKPAFEILDEDAPDPIGHQQIRCHMIFDVKLDLTRKARYVAGGHVTEAPAALTYQSVVSRESVRIAFTIAALNDLDVCAADIQNAYITAPCREKIWTRCGPEFGPLMGRKARIVRALYGLKSAARAFGAFLAETLMDLGWKPCRGESDVRMRSRTKENGEKIWEYLLVYTDDLLCIALNPRDAIMEIDKFFSLKPSSIGEPKTYLGAEISQWVFPDEPDKKYWAMGSGKYVKEAIRNIEQHLATKGLHLRKTASTPIPTNYHPELDVSPELGDEDATFFMSQISVLRWAVELGRLDIATEVSMLSSHMALPRQGHLDAVYHVFSFLKAHDRSRMVFDAAYQDFASKEAPQEWMEFYHDAKEHIPSDAPEPRGRPVQLIVFVDASHACDKLNRRSRTGILMFLNGAPISWLSKKQNSIETSSFGSEFTAMRLAAELVVAMRFKLRMMGIPLAGPAHVRCDNEAVVKNTSSPESTLQKKHNAVAYHYAREQVAAGVMEVHKEDGKSNLADMLTKVQVGPVRDSMAAKILR